MRLGECWTGYDGTEYLVVEAHSVKPDQPRWWLDAIPEDRDPLCGPSTFARLHLVPARLCGSEIKYALVTR